VGDYWLVYCLKMAQPENHAVKIFLTGNAAPLFFFEQQIECKEIGVVFADAF
jgi:hypothetical protein